MVVDGLEGRSTGGRLLEDCALEIADASFVRGCFDKPTSTLRSNINSVISTATAILIVTVTLVPAAVLQQHDS